MTEDYKVLRYAIQTTSEETDIRIKGYKNLLKTCNTTLFPVYLDDLLKNLKNDKISYSFKNELDSISSSDKLSLSKANSEVDNADNYFSKLNQKNLSQETFKIKDYAKQYYSSGNFSQYIMVFNRFIVLLKNEISESELHMYLVKYVIASVIKKQYDLAISEITKLKQHYHNYDISIYLFFLKIVQGKFHQAEEEILNISKNIYPEFFEKILDQETLAQYIVLVMLICYKKHVILSIVSILNVLLTSSKQIQIALLIN